MPSPHPSRAWPRRPLRAVALILCAGLAACDREPPSEDPRSAMHGIAAVQGPGDSKLVFFSSAGYPPRIPVAGSDWPHDVYVSRWDAATGKLDAPRVFLRQPEAQEPVAAAQAADGRILLTMEDGWDTPNTVTQRYGIYQRDLKPVRAYPVEVQAGGHSGDAAAVGKHFIVAYSEGWIHGGGVAELGSGNGIYARVYDTGGHLLHHVDVAPQQRAWWPRLAAGPDAALLIWQAFGPDERHARLLAARLDPAAGRTGRPVELMESVQYYVYSAAWLPGIRRYLVVATDEQERGHGLLLDAGGKIVARLDCMPATVREAGIAVAPTLQGAPHAMAYAPAADGRLLELQATQTELQLTGVLRDRDDRPVQWGSTGSVPLWQQTGELQWLSLSVSGLIQARFQPADAAAPDSRDRCQD